MSSSLEIGQTPDEQNWTGNPYTWDGGVGPCFLWNRPLSDAEVRALYNPQTRWDIYQQGTRTISLPAAAAPAGGRIMSSLVSTGGLAGPGGIAGNGGGLAG
jgi:hypothetical protein